MGLFKCAKCECIENTALGLYWMKNRTDCFLWNEENEKYAGKQLCSECAPEHYSDGKLTGMGEWHGKFPKEHISTIPEDERKYIS